VGTVYRNRYEVHHFNSDLKYAIRAAADHPFFKEHPDCKWSGAEQPQLYQYDGAMFVKSLLPSNPEIGLVGGPGKEFWINGRNYGSSVRDRKDWDYSLVDQPYLTTGEMGAWRIEISPKEPAENDVFLNVIQVGLKSQNPKPTEAKLVEARGGTGVEGDLGGGKKATVTFKAGIGGHIRIEQVGQSAVLVDQDLAEKVLPNMPIEK
jgi:hypothetical protein